MALEGIDKAGNESSRPKLILESKKAQELKNALDVMVLATVSLELPEKEKLTKAIGKIITNETVAYGTSHTPEEIGAFQERLVSSLFEGLKIQIEKTQTLGIITDREFRENIYHELWFLTPLDKNPVGEKWRRKMVLKGYPPSAVREQAEHYPQGTISALRETTDPIEIAREQLGNLSQEIFNELSGIEESKAVAEIIRTAFFNGLDQKIARRRFESQGIQGQELENLVQLSTVPLEKVIDQNWRGALLYTLNLMPIGIGKKLSRLLPVEKLFINEVKETLVGLMGEKVVEKFLEKVTLQELKDEIRKLASMPRSLPGKV